MRYAVYAFLALSFMNFLWSLLGHNLVHISTAAAMVFFASAAMILTLED